MQSRTSCFNAAVFWKTIRRYWPVWALWFAGWLLVMPLAILTNARFEVNVVSIMDTVLNLALYLGGIGGAAIALMSAMAVFSDIYNTRMAHGMACLPVSRGSMFVSRTLAGIVPLLAVNVVIFVITVLMELAVGAVCLKETVQWLAIVSMQLLLFYGMAVFCAQLTGSIVILPVVYVVMNFIAVGFAALMGAIAELYVVGAQFALPRGFGWFSPLYAILTECNVVGISEFDPVREYYTTVGCHFTGMGLIAVYAALGVVLLVLAAQIYRRRRTESAGDVVAVGVLKPAFRWCMGIGAGLSLAMLICLIYGRHMHIAVFGLVALIGAAIGWFAAEMMNRKSYHVLRSGMRNGFWLCCIVLVLFCAAIRFDVTGYERRVPDTEDVLSATVTSSGWDARLSDPASIAALTQAHEAITEMRDEMRHPDEDSRKMYIRLHYELKNGRYMARFYYVPYDVNDPQSLTEILALQDVMNSRDAIVARKETQIPVEERYVAGSQITLLVTAEEAARLSGYESGAEWLMRMHSDLPKAELEAMSEAERDLWLEKILQESAYMIYREDELDTAQAYAAATKEYSWDKYLQPVLETALFRYTYTLTPEEACELYSDCIVPDMYDGTIGRVWLITDDAYAAEVTKGEFRIELERELAQSPLSGAEKAIAPYTKSEYAYDHFSIVLTVSAARTNAWMAARGLPLRSIAESFAS